MNIQSANAGAEGVIFAGVTTTNGQGVNILNSSGAKFLGILNINAPGPSTALEIDNGGAVNSTGGAIDAGSGSGVDITGTELGMTLTSVSSSAGSNLVGIHLINTTGNFTITGNGLGVKNGSGGLIQNKTTSAILLDNASSVTLRAMTIQAISSHGIFGTNVTNFALEDTVISNAGSNPDEGPLRFDNLSGVCLFDNIEVSGGLENNVFIQNTSGVLNPLTIVDSIFRDTRTGTGSNGFFLSSRGTSNNTVMIQNSQFIRNRTNGVQMTSQDSATYHCSVTGSTFENNNIGINLSHDSSGNPTFDISNNLPFLDHDQAPININLASNAFNIFSGVIDNNPIGQTGVADSGSVNGAGIRIVTNGSNAAVLTAAVTNNAILQWDTRGIDVLCRDGNSNANLTITGNTVLEGDSTNGLQGIAIAAGATGTDTVTICAAIQNNNASGVGGSTGLRLQQRTGNTFNIVGLVPAVGASEAQVEAFVAAQNVSIYGGRSLGGR